MTLWEYLKGKMSEYGEKVAFAHSGVTYKELLNLPCASLNESKIVLCEGGESRRAGFKNIAVFGGRKRGGADNQRIRREKLQIYLPSC